MSMQGSCSMFIHAGGMYELHLAPPAVAPSVYAPPPGYRDSSGVVQTSYTRCRKRNRIATNKSPNPRRTSAAWLIQPSNRWADSTQGVRTHSFSVYPPDECKSRVIHPRSDRRWSCDLH